MADVTTNLDLDEITVAAASHQCLGSFAACLAQASAINPREFSKVEDQQARFSTWTSSIGVFAPGRASMDYRLRYAPEVQSVSLGLLDSLNHRIRTCSDIMDGHNSNPELDASALSRSLERSYSDIAVEISHLYKMSNMIRRASKESQALKIKSFQAKDEDQNVERMLLNIFKRYISDKFPNASDIIQQKLAEAMVFRRKRILYWRYRQESATKLPKTGLDISSTLPELQTPVPPAQVDLPQEGKRETKAAEPVVAFSEIQSATTLQPDKFKKAAMSRSSRSDKTIALSGHEVLNFPTAPGANAKRKYEQLKKERFAIHKFMLDKFNEADFDDDFRGDARVYIQKLRAFAEKDFEDTLKADIQALGEITCPYCLEALPALEVFDDGKWRKHVRNDLDPYVCLFENCDEADKLYKHSEQWLSHMYQHSQRWRCSSHRELDPFPTQEEYMQHMREAHNFNLGEKKLLILANRNARKTTKLFTSCPLCGESETEEHGRLENHITGHLRSLALKSLPPYQDDMDADIESGRGSCDSSQLRSEKSTDNPSTGKSSSTYGMNDEPSKLYETKDTYFMNDAPPDIDSRHMDSWNSIVEDLMSGKPTLQYLQQTSNEDPILKFMREKAKKSHLFPPTPLRHPQQSTLSESQQQMRTPLIETGASNPRVNAEPSQDVKESLEAVAHLHPVVEDHFPSDELHTSSEQLDMSMTYRGSNVPAHDHDYDHDEHDQGHDSDINEADIEEYMGLTNFHSRRSVEDQPGFPHEPDVDPVFERLIRELSPPPPPPSPRRAGRPGMLQREDEETRKAEGLTIESNTSPTPLSNLVERYGGYNGFGNLRLNPIVDYSSLHDPEFREQKPDELHIPSGEPNLSAPHGDLYIPPSDPTAQNPPCNTLYVGNLSVDVDEEELKSMFAKQRGYKRLAFRTKKNGPLCFVEFEDASSADRALHELYGQELSNSTKGGIRLSFSKNPLGVRSSQPPTSQETSSRNLLGHEAVGSASKSSAPSSDIDPSSEVDDSGRRNDGCRWCCGRWYNLKNGNFSKHLKSHNPSLLCEADPESCVRRFATSKELTRHYRAKHKVWASVHDISIPSSTCEACGATFTRPDNRNRHLRRFPECREKVEKMEIEKQELQLPAKVTA